jgi:mercuric ion transport protein
MTLQEDSHTGTIIPVAVTTTGARTGAGDRGAVVHQDLPPVDTKPPTRTKVAAGLAALACAACCALPFLIAAGVLTGAGAAVAEKGLLITSGVLITGAGAMWFLQRRRNVRRAAAGESGCASGNCAC